MERGGGTSIYLLIALEGQKNQDGGYNSPIKALSLLYVHKMRQDRKTLDAFELWYWMRLLSGQLKRQTNESLNKSILSSHLGTKDQAQTIILCKNVAFLRRLPCQERWWKEREEVYNKQQGGWTLLQG